MCVCVLPGHRGTDRYKAVPSGAEREKQREMVPGDPDHEEVSFTLSRINFLRPKCDTQQTRQLHYIFPRPPGGNLCSFFVSLPLLDRSQ